MRIALIGGTGFVGGYLVDALVEAGHEPTVLVREGSGSKLQRADACRLVEGDVSSADALAETVAGTDALIYNIGILREHRGSGVTFEALQFDGVRSALSAARDAGVRRFLLMSANGVKVPGTPYQETKYRAEQAALESGLDVTVFRPSIIFGDPRGTMEFATQLYRDMVRPPLPAVAFHTGCLPGSGDVLMSPAHARDVATAFVNALENEATIGKIYTIGGPEVLSWSAMLRRVAAAAGKKKLLLPMPIPAMKLAAALFDWLPVFPVTRDQLTMLAEGNVASPDELTALIGREPLGFTVENLEYLTGRPETT